MTSGQKRSLRKMLVKRSINVVITIIGIMTLNFALIHLMPGDPILNMVPRDPKLDPAVKESLIDKFNLDAGLLERYVTYMWKTMTLDWGTSYSTMRPVWDVISYDMRWTILLIGTATFFTLIIGMAIGAMAAYRRGGAFDLASTGTGLFFYGMPIFWFAMLLQEAFSSQMFDMNWWPQLPGGSYYDIVEYGPVFEWKLPLVLSVLEHLILPSITLAIASFAGVALVMRSSLVDVMTDDYILTAKAKGLTDYQILRRHALPNGMPPMVALIAMSVAFIIGGAYQIEYVFNYPGIGYRTINAIWELDFPILQFVVVVGGVAVVIANFVADLVLIYIDPRIKLI
jgi:peptide/nickel transport system permease protein